MDFRVVDQKAHVSRFFACESEVIESLRDITAKQGNLFSTFSFSYLTLAACRLISVVYMRSWRLGKEGELTRFSIFHAAFEESTRVIQFKSAASTNP
jgi:hypothetical protein